MARSWCVNTLRRIAGDLVPFLDGRRIGIDMLDVFEVQTELIYRELVGLEILGELDESGIVALGCVMKALALLRDAAEKIDVTDSSGYQASAVYDGNVGRPKFNISKPQLEYLLETNFTVPEISSILGVSVRTVRRRTTEYQLSVGGLYVQLTDTQLDAIVGEIQSQFPTCGNRQMQGHLRSRGIRVQQRRFREAQRRVDPVGCVLRRLSAINRRKYRVNGPLALAYRRQSQVDKVILWLSACVFLN